MPGEARRRQLRCSLKGGGDAQCQLGARGEASGVFATGPTPAQICRPRPFRSQRNEDAQELESKRIEVVVEVRLNPLTLIVEGLMINPRVVDAALIPGPTVSAVAETLVTTVVAEALVSTVVAESLVPTVVAGAEDRARLPMIPRVGGRRPDADTQPQRGQAQRADERGFDDCILQTHRLTPW